MSDVKYLPHKIHETDKYIFIEVLPDAHNMTFHVSKNFGKLFYGCGSESAWVGIQDDNRDYRHAKLLGLCNLLPGHMQGKFMLELPEGWKLENTFLIYKTSVYKYMIDIRDEIKQKTGL